MASATPSNLNTTIATVMSGLVLVAAIAGLIVAIVNLRKAGIDCGVHSLSMAYIIFFVLAVLAAIGAGGAIFRGTELASTAGVTLLTFMSASLFVLASLLFMKSSKIADPGLQKTNYAVFGIFALLSLINTGYLFYQRQNLIESQPVTRIVDFVRNRFGGARAGGAGASAMGIDSSPVRV